MQLPLLKTAILPVIVELFKAEQPSVTSGVPSSANSKSAVIGVAGIAPPKPAASPKY